MNPLSIFSTAWMSKLTSKLIPLLGVKITYVRFSDFVTNGGVAPEDATMQWNTVEEESGDGFTHDSSNGTIITIVKSGIVFVDGNINNSGTMTIEKNSVDPNSNSSEEPLLNSASFPVTAVRAPFTAFTVVGPGDKIRVLFNTSGTNDPFNRMSMVLIETDLTK